MNWQWAAWFGAGAASLFAVLSLWRYWERKRAQAASMSEIRRKFSGIHLIRLTANAYLHGLDRNWDGRWRGPGVLVLTRDFLYFRLWQRALDLTIPLERIERVALVTKNGAKDLPGPQLQVNYQGADGMMRTATWRVNRPHKWEELLNENLPQTPAASGHEDPA